MQLGEILHKSLAEIKALPSSEITLWMAYFKHKERSEDDTTTTLSTVDQFKALTAGGKENAKDQTR